MNDEFLAYAPSLLRLQSTLVLSNGKHLPTGHAMYNRSCRGCSYKVHLCRPVGLVVLQRTGPFIRCSEGFVPRRVQYLLYSGTPIKGVITCSCIMQMS